MHVPHAMKTAALATAALLAGFCRHAGADILTWNADANGNWNDTTKWTGDVTGTYPNGIQAVANLTSNLATNRTVTLNVASTVGALYIGDTNTSHTYTLKNSGAIALTFDNGAGNGLISQLDTSKGDIIQTNLIIAGNGILDIDNASANTLTISTSTTVSGLASGTQLLNFLNGNVTDSQVIADGSAGGKLAVVKNGTGAVTLSGANTFTGGLTVKSGTVIGTVTKAFGTSLITIGSSSGNDNATLVGGWAGTQTNAISVAAGNTGTASISSAANAIFSGAVTLNSHDLYLSPTASSLTLSGGVTGTGNLVLNASGAGSITLSTNTVNPAGTITNAGAGSGSVTIGAPLGAAVTSVVQNSASSRLILSGTSPAFTGSVVINAGVLQTGTTIGTGTIYLGATSGSADAALDARGTVGNPLVVRAGSSGTLKLFYEYTSGNAVFNGPITLANNLNIGSGSGGGGFSVLSNITGTGNILLTNTQVGSQFYMKEGVLWDFAGSITNTGTGTVPTMLYSNIGGKVTNITQNSASAPLLLTGTNTSFAGTVDVLAGTLMLGSSSAISNTGVVASVASGATLSMSGKPMLIKGLNDVSGAGGLVTNTGAAATLTLNSGTDAYAFSGTVNGSVLGNLSLVKLGTGTQTLSGVNSFTGTLTVNAGTLNMSTFTHAAGQAANPIVNGTGLGMDSTTPGTARLLFLNGAPTLVGTSTALDSGINAGVKNTQIVPFLVGEATVASGGTGTATGTANTFLTYNPTTGLRPLNPTDEFDNWTGSGATITSGAGNNVRVTGTNLAYNPGSSFAVNSLVISSGANGPLTLAAGKTLTITSGALLINANNSNSITGAGTLDFGTAEAIVFPFVGTTISAPVTLAGGALTKAGTSNLVFSNTVTFTNDLTAYNNTTSSLNIASLASNGAANLTVKANSTGAVTLGSGTINHAGTITNAGAGSATVTISGVIGPNVTGIVQSSTSSVLSLTGTANVFNGTVSATGAGATVQIAADGSLGAATNGVTLNNGATLSVAGTFPVNALRTITLNNGGKISDQTNGQSYFNLGGNIVGTGGLTIAGNGSTYIMAMPVLSGNNTFSGGLTLAGGAMIIGSEANIGGSANLTSTLNFNGGTLAIQGNQFTSFGAHTTTLANNVGISIDVQEPGTTFTLDRTLLNSGANNPGATFAKLGPGTLLVTASQSYTNGGSGFSTAFNGGVMKVDMAAGGSLANSSRGVQFGGGTFYLLGKGGIQTATQSLPGVYLNAGGGTIVVDNNGGSGSTVLATTTMIVASAGSSLNIITANVGTGSAAMTSTSPNDASGILGAGRVIYNGANFAAATGGVIGAYTGATNFVASGASGAVNYKLAGSASGVATESVNTLSISTGGAGQSLAQNAGTTLTLTSGGLLFTGSNDYTISGGSLNTTNSDLIVHQYGTGTLTISSVIANNAGASSLTKSGSGTLILTSSNSYTGQTYVNGGVLAISNNNQLGAVTTGALLNLNGTLRVLDDVTLDNAGANKRGILLSSNGGTFDIVTGKTLTVSGNVATTGASDYTQIFGRLTLDNSDAGDGTLVLGGVNNFAGGVVINHGILKMNSAGAINAAGVNTLGFGDGATAKLQMNGFNATVAGLTSASANAVVENGGATAVTMTVYNGLDNTYAGTLRDGGAGTLALAKGGGATLTLTGSNGYTGGTLVSNGILKAGHGNAFGTGNITMAGGVLDLRDNNVANVINITGTDASVLMKTSAEALTTAFAAGSNYRGWQRQSGLANNTLAQLLGGSNGGSAATMTSSWSASTDTATIVSDVLDIKGINGTTFVLQMNYGAIDGKDNAWEDGNVYLGWYNSSNQWVNAVLGNNNGAGTLGTHYTAAYDPAFAYTLGDWGIDSTNNVVWAVVNHNSDFAVVVPEPAMLALLGLGGLALLRRRQNG